MDIPFNIKQYFKIFQDAQLLYHTPNILHYFVATFFAFLRERSAPDF